MIFKSDSTPITATIRIDGKPQSYRCLFAACNNPTCTCSNLAIYLFKGRSKKPLHAIEIDVAKRKPARSNQQNPPAGTEDFTKQLFAQLENDDFQFLSATHFEYKSVSTEEADPKTIKASFNVKAVESGRQRYTYQEVLPFAPQLTAMVGDEHYLLLDHYCLSPTCDCTDVILSLFSKGRFGGKAKEHCLIQVDYKKKKWTMDEDFTSAVSVSAVRDAAEQQIELLYSQLEARHRRLKIIYLHNAPAPTRQILSPSLKVGRNAPCPCGSGKKYKKCCGRN